MEQKNLTQIQNVTISIQYLKIQEERLRVDTTHKPMN